MNARILNLARTVLKGLALAAALNGPLHAQDFPNKPLRWLVGFPAGGGTDFLARTVGHQLSQQLGQPVVIDNKPGAASSIAAAEAARAPADGYTLLTADNAVLIFNPVLYKKLAYDPARDFAPLGLMARFPLILAVHPGSGITSVQQLIDEVKKAPGRYSYASPGVGTPHHLAMELIKQRLGLFIVHVPYRGAAPAVQDVASGQVPMMIVESAGGLPMIKAGRLRPLAVVSARRMAVLPDVPTFAELGHKDLEVYAWQGVVVPKATPKPVVDKLSAELQKAVAAPEVRRKLVEFGMEVSPSDATLMSAYMSMETSLWHPLIQQRGIRAD
ncbi:Bug family tripartite tricarboxylate transporter substrate binding protein [Variovorax terrae]|uniref:Tripartite tricarboxylate transporter substrate binding protein n=1 Tax=Variovorax terrae TaxID=2923278 RepID=A0A9X1VW33_9BURK|nr:tripartite tricarboxylate transporter substrate binding protein [Variovorax terrae]MCJ0764831.1 tripartite tricarboxylate transporter substrate binding protein [Variovorax terrae]